ncbi:30S ribosomal protein S8 [Candidatus Nomurabacteria bacterium RIFCSPHIGHO2_01_FULL_39_9]|uniref:Small ribosomal subunit protein uS8 n=1 Tax=Candidatus Nomurabacteria bacterium RIFCSPHIGHO2_01_FULL_39_9 TaxID=1801735 RepID=A0A1F6UVN7_9BACT|nr:MAG: 30S ribosomal protein S8 [Candidatus Nomurabacteria bacterium RIFCSPHIGHO2_01_FULL_39_9]
MDPISNILTMILNAGRVNKESVSVPYSRLSQNVLECLVTRSFIKSVAKKTKDGRPVLEIALDYVGKAPRIHEIERISKPSRRMYLSAKEITPFKNGRGELVLSTSKGIMTGRDAKKNSLGGEILFRIW